MISWFVWKTINRNFNKPAIVWLHMRWRGVNRHKAPRNNSKIQFLTTMIGMAIIIFALLTGARSVFRLVFPVMFLMLISPLFIGTLTGVFATSKVIGDLSREHRFNRYEITAVTPIGEMGVFWLVSHIALNTAGNINGLRRMYSTLYIFAVVGSFTVFGFPAILSQGVFNAGFVELIQTLALMANVFILLLIDLNQSIFVGLFTGMIAASFRVDGITQRIVGIGVFLLLQVMTYMIFFWFSSLLPARGIIIAMIILPIFFLAIRELLLQLSVLMLARRLETPYQEVLTTIQEYP